MNHLSRLLAVSACAALLPAFASAATIVNDRWADSSRSDPAAPTYSEYGVDSDGDGDIESAWFRTGTGSTVSVAPGHFVNSAGAAGSMSVTTYFTPDASPVTLNNVGDKMTITWTFTPTGVTTSSTGNQDMRLAIVDSPNAQRISTDASPGSGAYTGYAAYFNMRAGTIGANNGFRIMEWAGGSNNLLSTANAYSQVAAMPTVANTTPGITDGQEYTFTWSIEKTATGADIIQSLVGGNTNLSVTYSDATPQPLTFDTFALRPQTPESTAASFDTHAFRVDLTVIPEPASLASGTLALALLRRRR